MGDFDYVDGKI